MRRTYSKQFKKDAVALVVRDGLSPYEAAKRLGIRDSLVRRWRKESEEREFGTEDADISALKPMVCKGHIVRIDRDYGSGGVAFIHNPEGEDIFFHRRNTLGKTFSDLTVGCVVEYVPVRARPAMGAGPRAVEVKLIEE